MYVPTETLIRPQWKALTKVIGLCDDRSPLPNTRVRKNAFNYFVHGPESQNPVDAFDFLMSVDALDPFGPMHLFLNFSDTPYNLSKYSILKQGG